MRSREGGIHGENTPQLRVLCVYMLRQCGLDPDHHPPGPLRPSSGPKWAKRTDYGGPLEGGGAFYKGKRLQHFSKSNFPFDPGTEGPIEGGFFRGGGYCLNVCTRRCQGNNPCFDPRRSIGEFGPFGWWGMDGRGGLGAETPDGCNHAARGAPVPPPPMGQGASWKSLKQSDVFRILALGGRKCNAQTGPLKPQVKEQKYTGKVGQPARDTRFLNQTNTKPDDTKRTNTNGTRGSLCTRAE